MAKKQKGKKQNKKQFWIYLITLVIIIAIVLAVFYVSNGYKFDFGFLEKDSESDYESVSVDRSKIDKIRDLKVYFIDIGQGDCIFIELPDGRNMLIDTGLKVNDNKPVIDKYLTDENGNKKYIDYCVATHPDNDHIGLMPYIYEEYKVGMSYRPYVYCENKLSSSLAEGLNKGYKIGVESNIYYQYTQSVYNEQSPWEFFYDGSDFTVDATDSNGNNCYYTVDFLMPYAKDLSGFSYFKEKNNFSAVIMLEYANKKILFTGDIEYENKGAEQSFIKEMLGYGSKADCDVLKVAHHGSKSSTSAEFLSLVKPEHAIISCGFNSYHHPYGATLNRLITSNASLYRTDLQGTIVLTIDSKGEMKFDVQTHKYDDMLFEDGDTIKAYEKEHNDEIEKFKKSLEAA